MAGTDNGMRVEVRAGMPHLADFNEIRHELATLRRYMLQCLASDLAIRLRQDHQAHGFACAQ